jgi:hypothetical protein
MHRSLAPIALLLSLHLPALAKGPLRMDESKLAIDYSTRAAWAQGFTDPKRHDPKQFRYMVSAIGDKDYHVARLQDPSMFEGQGVSMSVVDQDHQDLFGTSGYIFSVPPECIVVAHHDDAGSGNRFYETGDEAGFKKDIEVIAERADREGRESQLKRQMGLTRDSTDMAKIRQFQARASALPKPARPALRTPTDILQTTSLAYGKHKYNEIFVVGTSLDGQHKIRPIALFVVMDTDAQGNNPKRVVTAERLALLGEIARKKNLPLVPLLRKADAPAPTAAPAQTKGKK